MDAIVDKVQKLEVCMARSEEWKEDVNDWRKKQNGSLQRLEEKMDSIGTWLRTLLGGVAVSLALLVLQLLK